MRALPATGHQLRALWADYEDSDSFGTKLQIKKEDEIVWASIKHVNGSEKRISREKRGEAETRTQIERIFICRRL